MPIIAMSGMLSFFSDINIQDILITILVLCISLSFHEAAHAWAAYKLGDDTAALAGRLTLNPLAHLDPVGALVFLVARIGWAKPVPINPTRFDKKHSMKKGIVLTSLAGPLSNLLLAVGSAILLYVVLTIGLLTDSTGSNAIISILISLFSVLYSANVGLAVFNLLPMPPLDGYKVFGAMLPNKLYYKIMGFERYIGIAFLLLFFLGRGVLSTVLGAIRVPFDFIIMSPVDYLFSMLWQALGIF